MERYTIDRIEDGSWVVLEDQGGRTFDVPVSWLPAGAKEGDVVKVLPQPAEEGSSLLRFELDPEARQERLEEAKRLRDQLPKGPKGDLSL